MWDCFQLPDNLDVNAFLYARRQGDSSAWITTKSEKKVTLVKTIILQRMGIL
jgi:hypothetical protein